VEGVTAGAGLTEVVGGRLVIGPDLVAQSPEQRVGTAWRLFRRILRVELRAHGVIPSSAMALDGAAGCDRCALTAKQDRR
jgi:hypothetical protein